MSSEDQNQKMIAALLRERASCARLGREARVAAINEQLQLRGYTEPTKPGEDSAAPAGRTAERPERQTTAAGRRRGRARATDEASEPADGDTDSA